MSAYLGYVLPGRDPQKEFSEEIAEEILKCIPPGLMNRLKYDLRNVKTTIEKMQVVKRLVKFVKSKLRIVVSRMPDFNGTIIDGVPAALAYQISSAIQKRFHDHAIRVLPRDAWDKLMAQNDADDKKMMNDQGELVDYTEDANTEDAADLALQLWFHKKVAEHDRKTWDKRVKEFQRWFDSEVGETGYFAIYTKRPTGEIDLVDHLRWGDTGDRNVPNTYRFEEFGQYPEWKFKYEQYKTNLARIQEGLPPLEPSPYGFTGVPRRRPRARALRGVAARPRCLRFRLLGGQQYCERS